MAASSVFSEYNQFSHAIPSFPLKSTLFFRKFLLPENKRDHINVKLPYDSSKILENIKLNWEEHGIVRHLRSMSTRKNDTYRNNNNKTTFFNINSNDKQNLLNETAFLLQNDTHLRLNNHDQQKIIKKFSILIKNMLKEHKEWRKSPVKTRRIPNFLVKNSEPDFSPVKTKKLVHCKEMIPSDLEALKCSPPIKSRNQSCIRLISSPCVSNISTNANSQNSYEILQTKDSYRNQKENQKNIKCEDYENSINRKVSNTRKKILSKYLNKIL